MTTDIENTKKTKRKSIAKFGLVALLSATSMMPLACSNPIFPEPEIILEDLIDLAQGYLSEGLIEVFGEYMPEELSELFGKYVSEELADLFKDYVLENYF